MFTLLKYFFVKTKKKSQDKEKVWLPEVQQRKRVAEMNLFQIEMCLKAQALHPETFGKYKNIFEGKDVILVATGPSVDDYIPLTGENGIDDISCVGINRAFLYDKFKIDYLFAQDINPIKNHLEQLRLLDCEKFYGISLYPELMIPESVARLHNAKRYCLAWNRDLMSGANIFGFALDCANEPLGTIGSTVGCAMNFILYGNPRRIYLVGCDCTNFGYSNLAGGGKYNNLNTERVIQGWLDIKEFASVFYPETEIISVNPVGLRGMFKDLYQKEKSK